MAKPILPKTEAAAMFSQKTPSATKEAGVKSLTIHLEPELHKTLKTYAASQGQTIREVIEAYIKELKQNV